MTNPDSTARSDSALQGHTPGPWLMAAKASSVVGWPVVAPRAEGRVVCSLNYADPAAFGGRMPGDGAFNKESRANGLLIAAAPDMLAALVKMRDLLRKLQPALNVMARDVMDDIIADQIDPVIAKARGAACPLTEIPLPSVTGRRSGSSRHPDRSMRRTSSTARGASPVAMDGAIRGLQPKPVIVSASSCNSRLSSTVLDGIAITAVYVGSPLAVEMWAICLLPKGWQWSGTIGGEKERAGCVWFKTL